MTKPIPFTELRYAITALNRHIIHHMHNAVDRHHNNKNPEALFFAIIAFEELTKLSEYVDCYKHQKDVSVALQKKLSEHKYKLTRIPTMISQFMKKIPESDYQELVKESRVSFSDDQRYNSMARDTEIWREAMLGLNTLKQLILYFDWHDGREVSINSYMKNKITKNRIDHSAVYFIEYVLAQIREVRLKFNYQDPVLYTIPNEHNIMTEDEDWKYIEDFIERQKTELHASRDIFVSFLREIHRLGLATKS